MSIIIVSNISQLNKTFLYTFTGLGLEISII